MGPLGRRCVGGVILVFAALLAPGEAFAFVSPVALGQRSQFDAHRLDATAEIHCLALNVYHEARSEPDQGKFAVAQVTINRVRSPRYPDSICKVVWQRGQFSWTRDGRPDFPHERRAWEKALWVAVVAYYFHPLNMVGDATQYHAVYVHPYWCRARHPVARIGRHVFYAPAKRGS